MISVTRMPNTCYVYGCESGSRGPKPKRPNVRYLRPPLDEQMLKIWNRKIPRANCQLGPHSRVCSLHFREGDIIKENVSYVDGKRIAEPRKNWTLRSEAVPCIFGKLHSIIFLFVSLRLFKCHFQFCQQEKVVHHTCQKTPIVEGVP